MDQANSWDTHGVYQFQFDSNNTDAMEKLAAAMAEAAVNTQQKQKQGSTLKITGEFSFKQAEQLKAIAQGHEIWYAPERDSVMPPVSEDHVNDMMELLEEIEGAPYLPMENLSEAVLHRLYRMAADWVRPDIDRADIGVVERVPRDLRDKKMEEILQPWGLAPRDILELDDQDDDEDDRDNG